MSINDLRDLSRMFLEAANKARMIEEESLRRRYTGPALRAELAKVPSPVLEITAAEGKFIVVSDLATFTQDIVPTEVKTINLFSYKQGGYLPSHGFQILVNNVNGLDTQNPAGFINVHGSDRTWVAGTFANARDFFKLRRSWRGWVHTAVTGQSLLYLVVFPLTLWILFRLLAVLPAQFKDVPLFTFGLFVYAYLGCYQAFDRFLRYARWTFPLYEIEFARRQRFQKHRVVVGTLIVGVLSALVYDVVKFLVSRS